MIVVLVKNMVFTPKIIIFSVPKGCSFDIKIAGFIIVELENGEKETLLENKTVYFKECCHYRLNNSSKKKSSIVENIKYSLWELSVDDDDEEYLGRLNSNKKDEHEASLIERVLNKVIEKGCHYYLIDG